MDYTTIGACASAASAGWTCEVYAGTTGAYDEEVTVPSSGSSGSPITFIAHDAVIVGGFSISSQSYINIEGFNISTTNSGTNFHSCSNNNGAFLNNALYINISSNYFNFIYDGSFVQTPIGTPSSYVQILNNVMAFAGFQSYTSNGWYAANYLSNYSTAPNPWTNDFPCPSTISPPNPLEPSLTNSGGQLGIRAALDYSLIDGNDISEADHLFVVSGNYDVFRRNIAHDSYSADWGTDCNYTHVDFFHPYAGASPDVPVIHQVIENNQEYNNNFCNEHFLLMESYSNLNNNTDTAYALTGSGTSWSGTLPLQSSDSVAPWSLAIVSSSSTTSVTDNGSGTLVGTGCAASCGTINYSTGAVSVTFSSAQTNVVAWYQQLNSGSHDLIVRYNLADQLGAYFLSGGAGGMSGVRTYNNTAIHSGFAQDPTAAFLETLQAPISFALNAPNFDVLNSIFYDAWKRIDGPPWVGSTDSPFEPPATENPGYSLVWDSSCDPTGCPWSLGSPTPPGMVKDLDPLWNCEPNCGTTSYDFSLQSGSPALNAGTFLTTVASGDSGSGTSLVVTDAGFFQDGYTGIVTPDCVAVTAVSNTACITAINYSTNTITLAAGITRHVGDPVWLVSDSTGRTVLIGSAPNIGATFFSGVPPPPPPPAPMTGLTTVPH
jgi:hypothetical protein